VFKDKRVKHEGALHTELNKCFTFQTPVPANGVLPLNYTMAAYAQVQALVHRSVYCRQSIDVSCTDSALFPSTSRFSVTVRHVHKYVHCDYTTRTQVCSL